MIEQISMTRAGALTMRYDFSGRTAGLTGGTGVLGAEMARALAGCGADVVLLGRNVGARRAGDRDASRNAASRRQAPGPGAPTCSIGRRSRRPAAGVLGERGKIDLLVNGAGGNDPRATTTPEARFFDIPVEAWQAVTN